MSHPLGPVTVMSDELIVTPRLELHLIPANDLVTLFRAPDTPGLLGDKPYRNEHRVLMDNPGPLRWRVPQVERDPSLNRWFVRYVVLRSTRSVLGSISFHGAPDEEGMVEIGLGIEGPFRGQHFATEALLGMWTWACREPEVKTLRYTVSPENAPSVAIIRRFGFEHRGQQMDEIDGPEDIYEMSVLEFGSRFVAP